MRAMYEPRIFKTMNIKTAKCKGCLYTKNQEAGSLLSVHFALSKSPHLYRAYLVTICNQMLIAVYIFEIHCKSFCMQKRPDVFW